MNKKMLVLLVMIIGSLTSCKAKYQSKEQTNLKTQNMKSFISIFEIPATDIPRAVKFYKEILSIEIEELEFPGLHMGLFPIEDQFTVGVLIKGEDQIPSANGITIYLNAGNDLQVVLDKIIAKGGQIKVPKTAHADESGYFAIFIDSEGNRLGLHSIN